MDQKKKEETRTEEQEIEYLLDNTQFLTDCPEIFSGKRRSSQESDWTFQSDEEEGRKMANCYPPMPKEAAPCSRIPTKPMKVSATRGGNRYLQA